MTAETTFRRERLSTGDFNQQLHSKIAARLRSAPDTSDVHSFNYVSLGSETEISDYFFYEHTALDKPLEATEAVAVRNASLVNGTAILLIRSQDPHYERMSSFLLFRPVDVHPSAMTARILAKDGVDMNSEEYVLYAAGKGRDSIIDDPQALALVRELADIEDLELENPEYQQ